MYYSFDHVSPHSSLPLYQSAFNFMSSSRESESHDSVPDNHVTDATRRVKHLSTEYASQQLIKIQVNINEVNLDLNANGKSLNITRVIKTVKFCEKALITQVQCIWYILILWIKFL